MVGEVAKEQAKETGSNAISAKPGIDAPPEEENADPKDQARDTFRNLLPALVPRSVSSGAITDPRLDFAASG